MSTDDRDDEVVTPDEVTGPDGPPTSPPGRPGRPDRRPMWAMIAGFSALWFALLGPIFVIVLGPLAIWLGRRVMAWAPTSADPKRIGRQGKIGFFGGVLAIVLLLVQIAFVQLFFEWEKDVPDPDDKPAATAPAEGEGDGGGAPTETTQPLG